MITLFHSPQRFRTYATFGILYDGDRPFAVTMEPPVSIVLPGIYDCSKYFSPARQKWCYLISGIQGHSGVEIHTGVFPMDTKGCLITGESFEVMTDRGMTADGLAYSSKAYFELLARVKNADHFQLEVIG